MALTDNLIRIGEFLEGNYRGQLVTSKDDFVHLVDVNISQLNDHLVKVSFRVDGQLYSFRALTIQSEDDVLLSIQEKAYEAYLLRGVNGFVKKHANAHGAYLSLLNGFYFHLLINHYESGAKQFYFFGNKEKSIQF